MNKHHVGVLVDKNALVDEGDGVIRFPNKLVITDDSEQRNGTRYDIPTMDVSEYKGQVTADHVDMLGSIIAKVEGLSKIGNKVTIDAIRYAVKENSLARLAYDLLRGGFSTDFSIETYGEPFDEQGVYRNAKLIGLSQVVVGNNRNATLNNVVFNSIQQSKQDGLDVAELEEKLYQELNINQEHQTNNKEAEMSDHKEAPKEEQVENKSEQKEEQKLDINAIVKNAVETATKDLQSELATFKEAFSKEAEEPKFTVQNGAPNGVKFAKNEFSAMPWEERAVNQIESFRRMEKFGDSEAAKTLRAINEVNLEGLKKDGLVKNAITIGDLGNYVISPEQLSEIQGFRSDYSTLVEKFTFRETLSTVTQWLKRSGDINMTAVDYDDASITSSGYLKPVDDYSATLETMQLEELAAVTPVANSATRFLAADILSDVNAGYRTDYQRKLAQLIVARLEQAVDANGNSEVHNTDSDVNTVKDFASLIGSVAEEVPNGVLIMNHKSYWKMVSRAAGAGISGPLAGLVRDGNLPTLFGIPVVLVPNDLLPNIDDSATVSHTVDGSSVTINHAVFYVNPTNFVGRTSGGLMYDLSTDAAYESGGTVYSAFQRNQIVLRGSFFRGGEVADTDLVAGILAPGVS